MIFGNFAFSRLFRFTGATVTNVYVDLHAPDGTIIAKTLAESPIHDGWILSLSEAETALYTEKALFGHIVCVVGGVHTPVSIITINISRSRTARRV